MAPATKEALRDVGLAPTAPPVAWHRGDDGLVQAVYDPCEVRRRPRHEPATLPLSCVRDPAAVGADRWKAIADLERDLGRIVVIDTETTGLDGELIELAVVDIDGTVLVDTLVRPARLDGDLDGLEVNGIDVDELRSAPTWDEVYPFARAALSGAVVLAYNVSFDRRVIERANTECGLAMIGCEWRCALSLYSQASCEWRADAATYERFSLGEAMAREGLDTPGHRALPDALAVRMLAIRLALGEVGPDLGGASVAITGRLGKERRHYIERLLPGAGAEFSPSVAKADYIVAGARPGAKLARARERGVAELDERAVWAAAGEPEQLRLF